MKRMELKTENKLTMGRNNFVYWLQGFFEIAEPEKINKKQMIILKNHIEIVEGKENDFFIGFITALVDGRDSLNSKETAKLKNELQKQFLKVTVEPKSDLVDLLRQVEDRRKFPMQSPDWPNIDKTIIC